MKIVQKFAPRRPAGYLILVRAQTRSRRPTTAHIVVVVVEILVGHCVYIVRRDWIQSDWTICCKLLVGRKLAGLVLGATIKRAS